MSKPNCYECVHRKNLAGNCHIGCGNWKANVIGSDHAIQRGWFIWPFDFDPLWLISCTGFEKAPEKQTTTEFT